MIPENPPVGDGALTIMRMAPCDANVGNVAGSSFSQTSTVGCCGEMRLPSRMFSVGVLRPLPDNDSVLIPLIRPPVPNSANGLAPSML